MMMFVVFATHTVSLSSSDLNASLFALGRKGFWGVSWDIFYW